MVQDQMMTARVMDMMNRLDDNDEENEDDFDQIIGNHVNINKKMVINEEEDDEDDDDDLIRNTNFENITQTNKSQSNIAI